MSSQYGQAYSSTRLHASARHGMFTTTQIPDSGDTAFHQPRSKAQLHAAGVTPLFSRQRLYKGITLAAMLDLAATATDTSNRYPTSSDSSSLTTRLHVLTRRYRALAPEQYKRTEELGLRGTAGEITLRTAREARDSGVSAISKLRRPRKPPRGFTRPSYVSHLAL